MDLFTSLMCVLGLVVIGGPLGLILYGRSTGKSDRKFLSSTSVEDLWARAELPAEGRSRHSIYAFSHNYAGWTWNLMQDGKDLGTFTCSQGGEAYFNAPPLETKMWVGNATHVGATITKEIHVRDGKMVKCVEEALWNQFSLNDGKDNYLVSTSTEVGRVVQNDHHVGSHYKVSVDAHVLVIDKNVPDYITAIIISLLTMMRMK